MAKTKRAAELMREIGMKNPVQIPTPAQTRKNKKMVSDAMKNVAGRDPKKR